MLIIDYYAWHNRLRPVNPVEKTVFASSSLVIVLVSHSPAVAGIMILLMATLVVLAAGVPFCFYIKLLALPLAFLLVGALTIALTITRQPQAFLGEVWLAGFHLGFTQTGLVQAGLLLARSLAAVSCLYFLSLTTPMVEILALLRALRVPALFLELVTLVYHSIAVLLLTAEQMYVAQSSRQGYTSLRTTYRSLAHLVVNLFSRSQQHAWSLYTALLARGYTGELPIPTNCPAPLSVKHLAGIGLTQFALVLLAWQTGGLM